MTRYEAIEARRLAYEPRFVPLIRRELIRQGEVAAAAYEAGSTPELAAALVKVDGLVAVLSDLYAVVGVSFARSEYDALTQAKALQVKRLPGAELVAGWVGRLKRFFTGEGRTRATAMVETTRDVITRTIREAQAEGLSVPNTARLLRERVATLSQARAVVVARTELVAAANLGSLMGAQATGLKLNMKWLATPGPRTRDTHRAANGQTVTLGGTFTVGGTVLRYPGDPLGPAAEVVQCRCTLQYEPV
ncbi:hypothetical protein GCM10027048_27840 [Hymenobacter coalescens]